MSEPATETVDSPLPPTPGPRERLLGAMLQVVSEKGYSGTTVGEVVAVARLSKRTFYEHFSDREDCFLELYSQAIGQVWPLTRGRRNPDRTWREDVEWSMRRYLKVLAANPMLTRAFILELATISDRGQTVRRAAHESSAAELSATIEQARKLHPEVPSQEVTPLMASALIGGITELVLRAIERDETEQLTELVDVSTNMVWAVITSADQPPLG